MMVGMTISSWSCDNSERPGHREEGIMIVPPQFNNRTISDGIRPVGEIVSLFLHSPLIEGGVSGAGLTSTLE